MRHRVKTKKLNMDRAARKALVLNLVKSIVKHEEIETTITKAKFIRPKVEKLITKAKKSDLATRRLLLSRLRDKETVKKLLEDIGPRFEKRNGGYTRIQRTHVRKGDNAQMAKIMLVEKSKILPTKKTNDKVVLKEVKKEAKPQKGEKKDVQKSKKVKKETK